MLPTGPIYLFENVVDIGGFLVQQALSNSNFQNL